MFARSSVGLSPWPCASLLHLFGRVSGPAHNDVRDVLGGRFNGYEHAGNSAAAEKILGKPIIVENKPGGGGTVALALLANVKPDGYTLCGATDSGLVRAPQLQKVTYRPLKDFTPLIAYAQPLNGILVKRMRLGKHERAARLREEESRKIKYSSGGVGTDASCNGIAGNQSRNQMGPCTLQRQC